MKKGTVLFLLKLALWFNNRRKAAAQLAICPNGFVFGGLCGLSGGARLNGACPLTVPPFHCIRGSCCRDQRPLIQRLLIPTFYPNVFGNNNGIGIGTNIQTNNRINLCFDRAINCNRFIVYCYLDAYTVCMVRNCARTCGVCRSNILGGLGNIGAANLGGFGVGNLGGIGVGGLGAITGGLGGLG